MGTGPIISDGSRELCRGVRGLGFLLTPILRRTSLEISATVTGTDGRRLEFSPSPEVLHQERLSCMRRSPSYLTTSTACTSMEGRPIRLAHTCVRLFTKGTRRPRWCPGRHSSCPCTRLEEVTRSLCGKIFLQEFQAALLPYRARELDDLGNTAGHCNKTHKVSRNAIYDPLRAPYAGRGAGHC